MPLDDAQFAREAFARAIRPDPERTVADWAEAERYLGNEEGPFPGPWRTSRTPYIREPMEIASLSHPCPMLTMKFGAQSAKSQVLLNLLGQIATETPAPCLVVLPSIDEARSWNREKLQPMIDNSPTVRRSVLDVKSRDESSSTVMVKRFRGGNIELTGANSSKGLQMRTKRVVIYDEISEFPWDVDGRGDPVSMAAARYEFYTGRHKDIAASTPSTMGACRITSRYEASSKARFQVPCPHCGHGIVFAMAGLRWEPGRPSTAVYHCDGCGTAIQHRQKPAMMALGAWVHERPEMLVVHAGYALNGLYSPAIDWATVAKRHEDTRDDPAREKVFVQQTLGEAYEQRYDVVPHQILWERRTPWADGTLPAPVLFLEGATDVQGDRLEWGIYGFDRHMGQYWIDGGIILGDPRQPDIWREHDALLGKVWRDAWGRDWPTESWGIDSGYLSQMVYAYARRHAASGKPRVMALDGRPKWGEPPIGVAKKADVDWNGRKIGSVFLWPVGTWDIKTEIADALRLTEQGPDVFGSWPVGAMRFPDRLDIGFFEQLTAEVMNKRSVRTGYDVREWIKVRARNEQLDLAVYARALARHDTVGFDDTNWARLTALRTVAETPDPAGLLPGAPAAPTPVAAPEPRRGRREWIDRHDDWFGDR